jgi:hypothetical protein
MTESQNKIMLWILEDSDLDMAAYVRYCILAITDSLMDSGETVI